MRIPAVLALITLLATPCLAAESYKDVPKDHWAAESVQVVTDAGIMNGYPDQTFKGDKTVTRYELAVALQGMIQFLEQSQKPIEPIKPQAQQPKPEQTKAKPVAVSAPKEHWGKAAAEFLVKGNFLPKESPVAKGGDKPVSPEELSNALASVARRLIELEVPPTSSVD